MMRIIRVFNITKKNPCVFQNLLQGSKPSVLQTTKMSVSTDALKESLNEESLSGVKKNDTHDETDMLDASHVKRKNCNKHNTQSFTEFTGNSLLQNREALMKAITTMSPSSAVLLMKNLSSSRSRSLDVLNALSGKLQSNPPSSLIECSAVLYSASILNFRDVDLITKMSEQIINNKSQFVSSKLPINIMRSLGALKYNDKELIEVLIGSILFYKTKTPEDLVTSLTTLAVINAETPFVKTLVQMLSDFEEMDYSHPEVYLNFVWSCIILNEVNSSHISKVLSPDFINKVLDSDKQRTILLKLQNIHGAASSLAKAYNGPLLTGRHLSPPNVTKSKDQFLKAVKNGLYYICPKDGFLKFNTDAEAGFLIDVTCNVSPQGEIVRLKNNNNGIAKVGVILLDYHDFCLGSDTMTGVNAFKIRILQAKGYKALTIPYTEFSVSSRLSTKIDYLRKLFRSVV